MKRMRLSAFLGAALVVGLVAACGTTKPTASNSAIQPTDTATASSPPFSTPSAESTSSEAASSSASSEATPEASSAATPAASASLVVNGCAGSTDNQSWYVTATNGLPFDVYCPVLPATWIVDLGGGEWRGGSDQWLQISYKGPGGAKISIQEGAFCTGGLSLCSSHDSVIGPASFGDLPGTLDALGPTPADGYAIYIEPGTRKGYTITGTGMSQDAFTAIAAGLIKVAKG
jgi:hypothetical protein